MSREHTWAIPIFLGAATILGLCVVFAFDAFGTLGEWMCWLCMSLPLLWVIYYLLPEGGIRQSER